MFKLLLLALAWLVIITAMRQAVGTHPDPVDACVHVVVAFVLFYIRFTRLGPG